MSELQKRMRLQHAESTAAHSGLPTRTSSKLHAVAPFTGVDVTFKDVSVEVKNAKDKQPLKLLDGVSGALMAGQMTALMGPSGSGKTTLLDVLSGRKSTGLRSGTILYGGSVATKAYLRAATGYVEQHTTLIPAFTVYEMLLYTAEMKRSWREPRASKVAVVEALLQDLRLQSCAHVLIGDPMTKGISGGQAKRVSIGVAMVCVPPVLYLDEPTSGLDSQSAYEIMDVVRKTAVDGNTVAVAIHCPGPEVFAMFESVIALARGHIFYSGGTGDYYMNSFRQSAQPWLEGVADDTAFADVLLKAASTASAHGDALALAKSCSALQCSGVVVVGCEGGLATTPSKSVATSSETQTDLPWKPRANPGLFTVVMLLKHRAMRNWTRLSWILTRLVDKLLIAVIIVSLFHGQGSGFESGYLTNMTASLFMWALLPVVRVSMYTNCILEDRHLFYRERADGLYGEAAYLLYRALEEIVAVTFVSLAFSPFVFYVVQYQGSFLLFWLAYVLCLSATACIGFFWAALSPRSDISILLYHLYNLASMFSAGHVATLSSLPSYWKVLSRLSYVRYVYSAVILNQFHENNPSFTPGGQTVLEYMSMSGNRWHQLGYVSGFVGGLFTLAVLALMFINHQKR